jgi:hypothetical protein
MALEKQLLTRRDRAQGITIEFNLEGLLRADSSGRATFYKDMTGIGAMTINEVRALGEPAACRGRRRAADANAERTNHRRGQWPDGRSRQCCISLSASTLSPSDAGVIEGYASVFGGSPDSYGDIIAPGAFASTLTEHKRAGTMPLMLWGHDASQPPIGNWDDMAEDGKGLWVQGTVDLEDPMGQRVYRGLKPSG